MIHSTLAAAARLPEAGPIYEIALAVCINRGGAIMPHDTVVFMGRPMFRWQSIVAEARLMAVLAAAG